MNRFVDFVEIVEYSNWVEWDCYGEPKKDNQGQIINKVENGDLVNVKWPDRTIFRHKIVLVEGTKTVCDMGHDYTYSTRKANVKVKHNGVDVLVPLAQKGILVERL